VRCTVCRRGFPIVDGVVSLIADGGLAPYRPFLEHYLCVRHAENWSVNPTHLGLLPYPPPGTPHRAIWRRRARSFERLLALLTVRSRGGSLDILDLGAGNCWLARQLAGRGHRVEAVDINVDPLDGLAAAPTAVFAFGRIQSPMERLPYLDAQFDVVIAAAALHYARNLAAAVTEAVRVLRPGGALILLDTPIYRDPRLGQAVVAQRLSAQRLHYGSVGEGTAGPGYIAAAALRLAYRRTGLSYREVSVHNRPRAMVGRLRRRLGAILCLPERAQMPLVVGERRC